MEHKVIGVAGVARVGKDTFCLYLEQILKSHGVLVERVAFADSLKSDLKSFLLAKTGVSPYTIDETDKSLIRPLLVEYGRLMRKLTKGEYWIDQIKKRVEKNIKNNTISIVTDVRYANEANWINSLDYGLTVYLQRDGIYPANEEERINDPETQKSCSYFLRWNTYESADSIKSQTLKYLNGLGILKDPIRL